MERGLLQATIVHVGSGVAVLGRGAAASLLIAVGAACNSSSPVRPSPVAAPAAAVVTAASIQRLTVTGPATLESGQSAQVTATILLSDGTSRDVSASASWSSLDQSVCHFPATATVTTMSAGTCQIVAVYEQTAGQLAVSVTGSTPGGGSSGSSTSSGQASVTGLSLSGTNVLRAGDVVQWSATATMSDGTQVAVSSNASWASLSPAIASVSSAGAVKGNAAGTTTIVASYGGRSATRDVTVSSTARALTGLAITGTTNIGVAQTSQLQAVAQYDDGSSQTVTGQAGWSSSAPAVAAVAAGLVAGVTQGTTTITATYSGQTAQTTVTVSSNPATVTGLSITGNTSLTVGQTSQLQAVAQYSDGSSQTVTLQSGWSSSAPAVATVVAGLAVGLTPGSTTVTATFSNQAAQVTVNVAAVPPTMTGLSITGNTSLLVAQTSQLQAVAQFSDGSSQTVTLQSIWNSSAPTVATVVAGLAVGLIPGSTTVTATYNGQTAQTTVQVSTPTLVSLSISGSTSVSVAGTSQLQAIAHYSDGSTQTVTATAVWMSSAPLRATVAAGLVLGLLPGTSTISATYNGQTAQVTVTVSL